jgi:hypothetical protein
LPAQAKVYYEKVLEVCPGHMKVCNSMAAMLLENARSKLDLDRAHELLLRGVDALVENEEDASDKVSLPDCCSSKHNPLQIISCFYSPCLCIFNINREKF